MATQWPSADIWVYVRDATERILELERWWPIISSRGWAAAAAAAAGDGSGSGDNAENEGLNAVRIVDGVCKNLNIQSR